jgi:hypothetical protein
MTTSLTSVPEHLRTVDPAKPVVSHPSQVRGVLELPISFTPEGAR